MFPSPPARVVEFTDDDHEQDDALLTLVRAQRAELKDKARELSGTHFVKWHALCEEVADSTVALAEQHKAAYRAAVLADLPALVLDETFGGNADGLTA